MKEPKVILENGTKVITLEALHPTGGLDLSSSVLALRKDGAKGVIHGVVGGHGGDVYWVKHEDGSVAPYGWWEMELVP